MDEMALLLGLLVLSYLGNALFVPGRPGVMGLPSGAHFVVLGFLLGPHALGVVPSGAAESFAPLAMLATAWLALVLGVVCGHSGEQRLGLRAFLLGLLASLLSAAAIAGPVYLVARWLVGMTAHDAGLLALGIGLAGCETTRQSVRWVLDRGAVPSRLLRLLESLAGTDEIVPMLGMACFYALLPAPALLAAVPASGWVLLTLLLGAVLGITSTMLVSGMAGAEDAWSVLLGAALLGTGIAWRLTLSPVTTLYVMGVLLNLGSRHAAGLRLSLARTSPGVLLPALLLTGALLHLPLAAGPLWVVGTALVTRMLVRIALGYGLAQAVGIEPARRTSFGLALCSSGSVSVLVGLSFALALPGEVGDLVLSAAAVSGVTGDLLATLGLRQALVPREDEAALAVPAS